MSVELDRESLRKVGVDLVNAMARVLRCRTCGYVWAPLSARDDGRLSNGWWKCPNDPRHTQEKESPGEFLVQ
jgi:hypothetical protein